MDREFLLMFKLHLILYYYSVKFLMNLKESESINDFFKEDTKFIGEYNMPDYKVLRGFIPGFG